MVGGELLASTRNEILIDNHDPSPRPACIGQGDGQSFGLADPEGNEFFLIPAQQS